MPPHKSYRDWSKNDLVREVTRLRALLDEQLSAAPGIGETVEVQGIVTFRDRKPMVTMRAGEAAWQLTPAAARQHALIVLDAAVEAERDAALIDFVTNNLDMDEQAANVFLNETRERRRDWLEELRNG